MPHQDWCGNECADCPEPCALDESIPCSPDCVYLMPDGRRDLDNCEKAGCNAYEKIQSGKRIEVNTVFGTLFAEKADDPNYPSIYIGISQCQETDFEDKTLARMVCAPDVPIKGGHTLRLLAWRNDESADHTDEITFDEKLPYKKPIPAERMTIIGNNALNVIAKLVHRENSRSNELYSWLSEEIGMTDEEIQTAGFDCLPNEEGSDVS